MKNYLRKNKKFPCHYSVGAIVLNEENKIMCHYFSEISGIRNFHLMMRESPKINEPIEITLHRGLMEEFGAEAKIIHYVGSLIKY